MVLLFQTENNQSPYRIPDQSTNQPFMMSQAGDEPPTYSPSGAQKQMSEELKRRQEVKYFN